MKDEDKVRKKYNYMAQEYHDFRTKRFPKGWFYNEMYEMPAVIKMLGDVKKKKILDAGCGSGIYAQKLTRKGAIVKGFDISQEMLRIAKQNNPSIDLRLGSVNNIPFNEKFDVVFAALVVDYLENWDKMLKEVRRVLKDGGIFIFSKGNPIAESVDKIKVRGRKEKLRVLGDYFREGARISIWKNVKGRNLRMFYYHFTYETVIKNILRNGFEIIGYKDCRPIIAAKKYFPKEYAQYTREPYFCVFKLRKK